jgi:hypothetical protein
MGRAARAAADPHATEKVIDVIEDLLRARGTLPSPALKAALA